MNSLAQFVAEVARGLAVSIAVAIDELICEARKVADSRRH